jgi:SAM-dependent methyltransferase
MLSRAGRALTLRTQLLRHRGNRVQCPICEHRFDAFKDAPNRPNAVCWRCGASERHRAQWLLFRQRPELLGNASSLLHFAPEWCLRTRLERRPGLRYVTADLHDPAADLALDLQALALPDASFDAVICSHVLEHVPDDHAAMYELRRITRRWCLVMVPLDLRREQTYEDPSITSPDAREQAFWQRDHVRLYAADIEQRLHKASFQVQRIEPAHEFGAATMARCRLEPTDHMWLCRPV